MLTITSRCWLCLSPLSLPIHGICSYCVGNLPALPLCCPRCGLPSSHAKLPCGRCLQHPPPWQTLVAVSHYEPPLSQLINTFKFQGKRELAYPLARLMLLAWLHAKRQRPLLSPDWLLAVPLAKGRHWRRGFNQSELLAKNLAHWLNCHFEPNALSRVHATPPQRTLSAAERRKNLRGAFKCAVSLSGLNIVLIDDVVTTASTVTEISKILLDQGAQSVQIWCLCRTL